MQVAFEDFLGQRVFQIALDRAAHWPGAVNRVVTLLDQEILCLLVELKLNVLPSQSFHDLLHFEVQNLDQVRLVQRAENDDIVQSIQEFRPESFLGVVQNFLLHPLIARLFTGGGKPDGRLLADRLRAHVRGQQHNRIPEIHDASNAVGQLALFQNLQEHVHHVRMGLLHLVKQNDRIRLPADLLGQLTAFFVTHVTRGRAHQPRHRELLHVLTHVELDERFRVAEHVFGHGLGQQRLADAGRAEQRERADRPLRILQIGP